MKKLASFVLFAAIVSMIVAIPVAPSQAITIGGPCDTALDEYGGQNAQWNFMCIQYAIAIGECIDAGDCDFYN